MCVAACGGAADFLGQSGANLSGEVGLSCDACVVSVVVDGSGLDGADGLGCGVSVVCVEPA